MRELDFEPVAFRLRNTDIILEQMRPDLWAVRRANKTMCLSHSNTWVPDDNSPHKRFSTQAAAHRAIATYLDSVSPEWFREGILVKLRQIKPESAHSMLYPGVLGALEQVQPELGRAKFVLLTGADSCWVTLKDVELFQSR